MYFEVEEFGICRFVSHCDAKGIEDEVEHPENVLLADCCRAPLTS